MKLFSELWIETIGWTLVHSLWLIAVTALILRLLLWLIPKSSVRTRYIVAVAALVVTVGSLLFTGYRVYQSRTISHTTTATYYLLNTPSTNSEVKLPDTSWWATIQRKGEQLQSWLSPHLSGILVLWFSGVLFFMLRSAGKVAYVYRLARQDTHPLSSQWEASAQKIKQALGVQRRILIRTSTRIRSPFVIGLFRPVILLPLSSFSQLSYEQMEAILAHELAHIRRWDDAVNWLQTAIEIVLFYHPAVWWISQLIRDEREKCCDDLAVATCGNALIYAQALTQLETLQSATSPLALALARQGGGLLTRIERLLQPKNVTSKISITPVVLTLLLITSFVVSYRVNPTINQTSDALRSPVYSGAILGLQSSTETDPISPWQPKLPDWLKEKSSEVDTLPVQKDTIPAEGKNESKPNYYIYTSPSVNVLRFDSLQGTALALDSLLSTLSLSSPDIKIRHDGSIKTALALDSILSIRAFAAPDVQVFSFDSLANISIFSPDSTRLPKVIRFPDFDSFAIDSTIRWGSSQAFAIQFSDTLPPPGLDNLNIPLPPIPNIEIFTDSISENSIRVYEKAMREYERALARLDSSGDWEENLEQQLQQLENQQLQLEKQMRIREQQYEQQLQQWQERMKAWEQRQQEQQLRYEQQVRKWAERQEEQFQQQKEQLRRQEETIKNQLERDKQEKQSGQQDN